MIVLPKNRMWAPLQRHRDGRNLAMGDFHRVMFSGTLRLNRRYQVVFATLTISFFMLAIGDVPEASPGFRQPPDMKELLWFFGDLRPT